MILPLLAVLSLRVIVAKGQSCSQIDLPPYGLYVRGPCFTSVGSACAIDCEPNFDLIGSCYRICGNNGVWSGAPVQCIQPNIQCPSLRITNGVQLVSGCQNFAGFTCEFGCPQGAPLQGNPSIYCQRTGDWTGPVPTCSGSNPSQQCQLLIPPPFGSFASGNTCPTDIGSTCQIICNNGYTPSGYPTLRCLPSGLWDATFFPTCVPNSQQGCTSLTRPAFGDYVGTCSTQATVGQSCTFSCNPGYTLTGPSVVTCLNTGWSSLPPQCQGGGCDSKNAPTNGQVSGQCIPGVIGRTCIFNCFPGFELIGLKSITCGPNGVWNGAAATCRSQGCGPPFLATGGLWLENSGTSRSCPGTVGSTCQLICSQGYILQGNARITCLLDQSGAGYRWQPPVGTCLPSGAPQQLRALMVQGSRGRSQYNMRKG